MFLKLTIDMETVRELYLDLHDIEYVVDLTKKTEIGLRSGATFHVKEQAETIINAIRNAF